MKSWASGSGIWREGALDRACSLGSVWVFLSLQLKSARASEWNSAVGKTVSSSVFNPLPLLLTPRKTLPSSNGFCQMAMSPWEFSQGRGGGQDEKERGRWRNKLLEASQWLWGKVGSQSPSLSTSGLGRALDIILANLYVLGHEPKIQAGEGTCPRSVMERVSHGSGLQAQGPGDG